MRAKPTHRRANGAEKSRLVTLDQEIEGSNPSSPAIVSSPFRPELGGKGLQPSSMRPISTRIVSSQRVSLSPFSKNASLDGVLHRDANSLVCPARGTLTGE